MVQQDGPVKIEYILIDEFGPENDRQFKVRLLIDNQELGIGIGHSKKGAEQKAAQQALKKLEANDNK